MPRRPFPFSIFPVTTAPLPARLAWALAALLAAGSAAAQAPADTRDLEQARADLARAAARVAELGSDQPTGYAMQRPVLGVVLAADPVAGVGIAAVTPGSAAAEAGLRGRDRLLAVGDSRILGSDADLRLRNARGLLRALEAGRPVRVRYERDGRTADAWVTLRPGASVAVLSGEQLAATLDQVRSRLDGMDLDGIVERARLDTDGIEQDVQRALAAAGIGIGRDCGQGDCTPPVIAAAMRWNGLNLASVDAELGRYFGTDRGVLVLSTGGVEGLRAGDVIQRVDGTEVTTPREVMRQLRGRDEATQVAVTYLRDRRSTRARITVPPLRPLRIPARPAPASAPAAPSPPAASPPAALAAPATAPQR